MSRKIVAIILLCTPLLLIVVIPAYAIFSFVFSALANGADSALLPVIGQIVNVVLGFLGIIGVLGLVVGFPVGLILLLTDKSDNKQQPVRKTS